MKSWIYFARHGSDGPIKIGRAHDPRRRVMGLAVGSPVALVLLGAVLSERAKEEEDEIHDRLRMHCVRGEWFSSEGALHEMERLTSRMVSPEELAEQEPPNDALSVLVNFRLMPEELENWKAAARREDVPFSRWARERLNAAVRWTETAEGEK